MALATTGPRDGDPKQILASLAGLAPFGVGRVFGAAARAGARVARAEKAVTAAGSDAARLAAANAELTAARAGLPTRPFVPRADHLKDALPHRMVAEVRSSWQATRAGGVRATAARELQETRDAALGRNGLPVAANTAVRLGADAGAGVSDVKSVVDAARGSSGGGAADRG